PAKEDLNTRIAVSAYYKAQVRGFEPGYELADWLAAEAEQLQ
ncbi:MAG TPA: fatty acid hydroxylase, partial [Nitrosomonas sp.]|nr:fatty acid hydroxylase [Nitrosomonas sp.]